MTTFFIPGEPAAQGSKRHVGNGRMIESSKKLPAWRAAIKTNAEHHHHNQPPIDAPVRVTARFFLPKPKKPRFPIPATALDLDKLCRALGDGLESGGLLKNDARIVSWHASKHYATEDQPTGVHVTIIQEEP